jgi:hypothetical protein
MPFRGVSEPSKASKKINGPLACIANCTQSLILLQKNPP